MKVSFRVVPLALLMLTEWIEGIYYVAVVCKNCAATSRRCGKLAGEAPNCQPKVLLALLKDAT